MKHKEKEYNMGCSPFLRQKLVAAKERKEDRMMGEVNEEKKLKDS